MDFFLNKMKASASECPFDEQDIQQCPFLRNISKPTNLSFSPVNLPVPVAGFKGPIFEDGPNFDLAFNLFHGKDGVVPLSRKSSFHAADHLEPQSAPMFNPLAAKAATISLSSFGLGGPFGFNFFSDKWKKQKQKQKQKSESSGKKDNFAKEGKPSGHEALSNEWLQTGNCPIAKSYRAVNHVLPLVAKHLQPPSGVKLHCPPAIVAARAALARTAFVKNLRPQPLPAKMLCIAALGMASNIPLGIWREHTPKFSLSWFIAVHAAVPFIAMLRKAVLMPKTAMALTVGASILGQVIGSRAERIRLKSVTEKKQIVAPEKAVYHPEKAVYHPEKAVYHDFAGYSSDHVEGITNSCCGNHKMMLETLHIKGNNAGSSGTNVCF